MYNVNKKNKGLIAQIGQSDRLLTDRSLVRTQLGPRILHVCIIYIAYKITLSKSLCYKRYIYIFKINFCKCINSIG
jgi:hypothetical protein